MSGYDSKPETLEHINTVADNLISAVKELLSRAVNHDRSKLDTKEKKGFDMYTPKLKECTYGSDEYKQYLKELTNTLEHHYAHNSHHPEHFPNGIDDFDLFDLMEMFFDWDAATKRHNDGDIIKSIEINKERFGISDQITNIFKNTVKNRNTEEW